MCMNKKRKELEQQIGALWKAVNVLRSNFRYFTSMPEVKKKKEELHGKRLEQASHCPCFVTEDRAREQNLPEHAIEDCTWGGKVILAPCYYLWYGHCPYGKVPDES